MPDDRAALAAVDLWKVFPTPVGPLEVLRGVSFAPEAGKITAVVGASGSGKSTLLHVLGTLERPSRGQVLYGREEVFRWDDSRLARFRNRAIGFVFQFHHLMPEFSAQENVMMPALVAGRPREEARREALDLLGRVGLTDRRDHRPAQLSGGEQQRVAVARALVNRPRLVLADEPSGNLDREAGRSLHDLIFSLTGDEGETFVIVTHDDRLAARADRVMLLDDGRLTEIERTRIPGFPPGSDRP